MIHKIITLVAWTFVCVRVIFFQVEDPATGRAPVQRSPNMYVWVIERDQVQQ